MYPCEMRTTEWCLFWDYFTTPTSVERHFENDNRQNSQSEATSWDVNSLFEKGTKKARIKHWWQFSRNKRRGAFKRFLWKLWANCASGWMHLRYMCRRRQPFVPGESLLNPFHSTMRTKRRIQNVISNVWAFTSLQKLFHSPLFHIVFRIDKNSNTTTLFPFEIFIFIIQNGKQFCSVEKVFPSQIWENHIVLACHSNLVIKFVMYLFVPIPNRICRGIGGDIAGRDIHKLIGSHAEAHICMY